MVSVGFARLHEHVGGNDVGVNASAATNWALPGCGGADVVVIVCMFVSRHVLAIEACMVMHACIDWCRVVRVKFGSIDQFAVQHDMA